VCNLIAAFLGQESLSTGNASMQLSISSSEKKQPTYMTHFAGTAANIYFANKQYPRAAETYSSVVLGNPCANTFNNYGVLLQKAGDFNKAEFWHTQALRCCPRENIAQRDKISINIWIAKHNSNISARRLFMCKTQLFAKNQFSFFV